MTNVFTIWEQDKICENKKEKKIKIETKERRETYNS